MANKTDPRVTKRKVIMRSVMLDQNGDTVLHHAEDYVRPDFLDAYVADAKTKWQSVTVSDEPDAGPGGYEGETHVPGHLDHELAGQTFAAIEKDEK
jgi:hypothetical protein